MDRKKKLGYMYILVHFFEENKFSVLKLKDCINAAFSPKEEDIPQWDTKKPVEIMWDHNLYPAYILQFGDSKKQMDKIINELAEGIKKPIDIPLLQTREISIPKITASNKASFFNEIKMKINDEKECENCKIQKKTIDKLRNDLVRTEASLASLSERHKILKAKYRNKKKQFKEMDKVNSPEYTQIGDNIIVDTNKLLLCRTNNFSKYVGDILEVIYGPNELANSMLRGKRESQKKVLDPNIINDIVIHVVKKFHVSMSDVKYAIRQKLNSCHKANKTKAITTKKE